MNTRKVGQDLIQGMHEAVNYMQGNKSTAVTHKVEIPDHIDVRNIRKNLNLSRSEFALRFGFSPRTIQHWELGDRHPRGPARILLVLLKRDPQTIEYILTHKQKQRARR